MIFCSNPKSEYLTYKFEIDEAVNRVLHSGWYILGKEVETFEVEFAKYIGVKFAIGVGSGTEAIHLALSACGIKKGDEVITVSHTAVATISAIEMTGATPVFVDIESDYFTIDPNKIKAAITPNTKAIIPVHMYGQPADMDPIVETAKENSLWVIEDCAQAHGAEYKGQKVGSIGHLGCFSFYPTKNLGGVGDGGAIITNSKKLEEKIRLLHQYGWEEKFISKISGWNSRLDEIQAAVLSVKLKHLDDNNRIRREIAAHYSKKLKIKGVSLPKTRKK